MCRARVIIDGFICVVCVAVRRFVGFMGVDAALFGDAVLMLVVALGCPFTLADAFFWRVRYDGNGPVLTRFILRRVTLVCPGRPGAIAGANGGTDTLKECRGDFRTFSNDWIMELITIAKGFARRCIDRWGRRSWRRERAGGASGNGVSTGYILPSVYLPAAFCLGDMLKFLLGVFFFLARLGWLAGVQQR